MKIRYVGEDRHGYPPGDPRGKRIPVPTGSRGCLLKRTNAGCLVEVKVDGELARFFAPPWQLRKLVKK